MRLPALLLGIAIAGWAQAPLKTAAITEPAVRPSGTPAPSFESMSVLEKKLDAKITNSGAKDPFLLLGFARVFYLPGFGAVITQELSLVVTPVISPFQQTITHEQAVKVHERKIAQLPLMKKVMRDIWTEAATSLPTVPPTEQVVLALRLLYQPWEDTAGLPAQLVMRGPRNPALASTIVIEEQ